MSYSLLIGTERVLGVICGGGSYLRDLAAHVCSLGVIGGGPWGIASVVHERYHTSTDPRPEHALS